MKLQKEKGKIRDKGRGKKLTPGKNTLNFHGSNSILSLKYKLQKREEEEKNRLNPKD